MKKYILPVFLGLLAAAGITFAETNDDSGGWFFDGTNATINNNVAIPGDLTVSGTCTGCAASETDPIVGAITGIVKADGATNIAAAVAGTDYAAPNQTMYIGTTAVAINRATAALTLG